MPNLIKPAELSSDAPHGPWSCRGHDIWDMICAAVAGDVPAIRRLLARDANLYRCEYWYTQPLHFAVREGHVDAVRALLAAGADPTVIRHGGDDLLTVARDRGHEPLAHLLEQARATWSPPQSADHPVHTAAAEGDLAQLHDLLNADPSLLHRGDRAGRLPLHRAVAAGQREAVGFLLDRGADPNWPEGRDAPRGAALHAAARSGDQIMVEVLLAHGADPNGSIDSAGSATYAAKTKAIRDLLIARGGQLDAFDLVWLEEDRELLRRAAADSAGAATSGCGGVFTAVCTQGKRDLLEQLLVLGVRVPPVVTGCRTYLWSHADMLQTLLERGGMSPNLPDWQHVTPLHNLCGRDGRGRAQVNRAEVAAILLDHGADLNAVDEEYRSTPLGWAARNDLPDMVELLLTRGAATSLPDEVSWATPLAWAQRRGHGEIEGMLRQAGAAG